MENLVPKYFKRVKFISFLRRLGRWGFESISTNSHSFKHPLFQRGKRDVAMKIRCPKPLHQVIRDEVKRSLQSGSDNKSRKKLLSKTTPEKYVVTDAVTRGIAEVLCSVKHSVPDKDESDQVGSQTQMRHNESPNLGRPQIISVPAWNSTNANYFLYNEHRIRPSSIPSNYQRASTNVLPIFETLRRNSKSLSLEGQMNLLVNPTQPFQRSNSLHSDPTELVIRGSSSLDLSRFPVHHVNMTDPMRSTRLVETTQVNNPFLPQTQIIVCNSGNVVTNHGYTTGAWRSSNHY